VTQIQVMRILFMQ